MEKVKLMFIGTIGVIGAFVSNLFGGWSNDLTTLLICMITDIICGFFVAFIYKNSPKTDSGAGSSKAFFKGICKKIIMLILVIVAYRMEITLSVSYIKSGTVIAFITNEIISIFENAGLMGITLPKPIQNALDILIKRSDDDEKPDNK